MPCGPPSPPPSPPPPLLSVGPALSDNATVSIQSVGSTSLTYGEWSVCSASCGPGVQTRSISCIFTDGSLLPLSSCSGGSTAVASRACQ